MKYILYFFLIFISMSAFSQSKSELKEIDKILKITNTEIKNYDNSLLKDTEKNSEISIYQDFFCNIKLIKELYLSETGKTTISTYFGNNHPVYILKQYLTYKYPATDAKHNAKEFIKSDEIFYLKNERIIQWVKDKKKLKKYPKNAASVENNMIAHINEIAEEFYRQFPNKIK